MIDVYCSHCNQFSKDLEELGDQCPKCGWYINKITTEVGGGRPNLRYISGMCSGRLTDRIDAKIATIIVGIAYLIAAGFLLFIGCCGFTST